MTNSFPGWDRDECKGQLRAVIPPVWQRFIAEQGSGQVTGFALFSAVDHGYFLLSGFTRQGQDGVEPPYRWSPPESPHYELAEFTENDFPLASGELRDAWFEDQEEQGSLHEAPEYWQAFLALTIEVLRDLRSEGTFGNDPRTVVLAIDADAGTVLEEDEAIVRILNPVPAQQFYQSVLAAVGSERL